MDYNLIHDVVALVQQFEVHRMTDDAYSIDSNGFKRWLLDRQLSTMVEPDVDWQDKAAGRSVESAIATQIVHMNRFGKAYFKSVIHGTDFSTPEDVIYLIVVKFNPNLTKIDLIKKNVHEKPAGMQIIGRLLSRGLIEQVDSSIDKRSKVLNITDLGVAKLDNIMLKMKQATEIVSGNLTRSEKMQLISLLNKLNQFHLPIYEKQIDAQELLEHALTVIQK